MRCYDKYIFRRDLQNFETEGGEISTEEDAIADETLENNTVTVRDRDTMEQVRIKIDELDKYLEEKIEF